MSLRGWMSLATFVLIGVILFFSRHELGHAWGLLGQVNIWLLLLLIPGQMLVYYAGGEMIFSYLRSKGRIMHVSRWQTAMIALEGNFVNHLLPSGGVSGISYLTWRLGHFGVPPGRATMAQVVRQVVTFGAFALLLFISLFVITLDGAINRWIILVSALLVGSMMAAIAAAVFFLSSNRRTQSFSKWLVHASGKFMRWVTMGRKRYLLKPKATEEFFEDMHRDFLELRHETRLLIKPFLWGVVFIAVDAGLFYITFLALGEPVNPAPILIAYGIALFAAFFVITPGGAGAYEAIMVAFLAVAGLSQGVAIAGVVLTRVILLLGTILCGYVFYQRALLKYGKSKAQR